MDDYQEFVCQQFRIGKHIGDAAERLIRFGANDGRVFVKPNLDDELRQLEQLGGNRRPFCRHSVRSRFYPVGNLLPQRGDIQIRRSFKAGKLVDPVRRCAARRGLRRGWGCDRADQQGNVPSGLLPRSHQRYPASAMALLQFMLTPRGPANRHSRALPLSPFWMSPQNLVTSRAHSLATAERAATRFWIASKARP